MDVLQSAGGVTVDPTIKNDILRQYVVAAGSDGYEAVISAGEISSQFGNQKDLVAASDALNQLPSPSGFARVVATGDLAGGRPDCAAAARGTPMSVKATLGST